MERFLIVYRGAPESTPADAPHDPAPWNAWFERLDGAVVDRGSLSGGAVDIPSRLLGPKESTSSLSGYSIISAADFNEIVALTESCPIYDLGGSMQIARLSIPL